MSFAFSRRGQSIISVLNNALEKMKSLFVAISSAALLASLAFAADHDRSMTSQNKLSAAETKQGWKLLFNGKDFTGWHNFKSDSVKPGWKVENGDLVCADPHNAGD